MPVTPRFVVQCGLIFLAIAVELAAPRQAAAQNTSLRATVVVSGLTAPVAFVQDPTQPGVQFVVEQGGRIRVVRDGALLGGDFLNLAAAISSGGEQGLLGLAFAPDYATSRRFFVNFTNPSGHTVIARFLRSGTDSLRADPSTRFDLRWPDGNRFITQPFANHNGGDVHFGSDGYLYIGMGDGGSGNDPNHFAQNPMSLLGKMLRIDVAVPDSDPEGYNVPFDNPFVGDGRFLTEIWALGLRNPFRFTVDDIARGGSGALVIGDVGQNMWEEVDFDPFGRGGRNYGWRNREGAHDNVTTLPPATLPLIDPIVEYLARRGERHHRGRRLSWLRPGTRVLRPLLLRRLWREPRVVGTPGAEPGDRRSRRLWSDGAYLRHSRRQHQCVRRRRLVRGLHGGLRRWPPASDRSDRGIRRDGLCHAGSVPVIGRRRVAERGMAATRPSARRRPWRNRYIRRQRWNDGKRCVYDPHASEQLGVRQRRLASTRSSTGARGRVDASRRGRHVERLRHTERRVYDPHAREQLGVRQRRLASTRSSTGARGRVDASRHRRYVERLRHTERRVYDSSARKQLGVRQRRLASTRSSTGARGRVDASRRGRHVERLRHTERRVYDPHPREQLGVRQRRLASTRSSTGARGRVDASRRGRHVERLRHTERRVYDPHAREQLGVRQRRLASTRSSTGARGRADASRHRRYGNYRNYRHHRVYDPHPREQLGVRQRRLASTRSSTGARGRAAASRHRRYGNYRNYRHRRVYDPHPREQLGVRQRRLASTRSSTGARRCKASRRGADKLHHPRSLRRDSGTRRGMRERRLDPTDHRGLI